MSGDTTTTTGTYPFLSTIEYPNGLKYQFSYVMNPDGSTTGELKWITLPLQGTIEYTYPSGYDYLHRYKSLQRTISNGAAGSQTYTYQRTDNSSSESTTTITNDAGDVETINYSGGRIAHITVRNASLQVLKEVQNT